MEPLTLASYTVTVLLLNKKKLPFLPCGNN